VHAEPDRSQPLVVFVTAHDEFAVEAFELNAVDYLLKPVRAQRLLAALRRALTIRPAEHWQAIDQLARATLTRRRHLSVHERGRVILVPVEQVIYLKAELKYITVRTVEREYLIEESLTALEEEFGERFVRIHRNALVARDSIGGFERVAQVESEGGIRIGRSSYAKSLSGYRSRVGNGLWSRGWCPRPLPPGGGVTSGPLEQ